MLVSHNVFVSRCRCEFVERCARRKYLHKIRMRRLYVRQVGVCGGNGANGKQRMPRETYVCVCVYRRYANARLNDAEH